MKLPQGMLHVTAFIQSTMAGVLRAIHPERCMVWVDDLIVWEDTPEEIIDNLDGALERLQDRDIYVAARKRRFFAKMKRCGRIYSG